jgi:hypothetical protein
MNSFIILFLPMSPTENVPFEIEGWCGVRMEWGVRSVRVGCGVGWGWGEGTTVLTLTPTPHPTV